VIPEKATVPHEDGNRAAGTGELPHTAYRLGDDFSHLQQARIMMVDDEPIMMDVVQTFLEDAGYCSFHLVDDSTQALGRLREYRPDVLLLDLVMPKVSGFEVLQALRCEPEFKHLPVIILTSSSDAVTKLQALDLGATDFLSKPVDPSELALRMRNTLALKAYQDQLAFYDVLTNLPNRRLFQDRTDWAIQRARNFGGNVAMLHIVFDELKRVTDTFGPATGDELLKHLTKRLLANVRASDALSSDGTDSRSLVEVFRLGSVDFAILLPLVDGLSGAASVAGRILNAMGVPLDADGTEIYLAPSIGIAGYPVDGEDTASLVKSAVGASSQALAQGGGRLQFYSNEMNKASLQRLRLEADMRRALENGEFGLLYQPRVSVSTGAILGAEALIRWHREDGKAVSPDEFIQIAEETGLILALGEWVLREACRQIKAWEQLGVDVKVSINVSAKQFFDADLVGVVKSAMTESGVKPASLILEMTESLLMDRAEVAVQILHQLHDLGLEISIDDFGTGYSSFSYLKMFPMDEVKIDKSFLVDAVNSREDQALISAMTNLAHEFGFRVCAEGVEEDVQLALLRRLGCDEFQGYLFSRPISPAALAEMIAR
jgi:diguanylate cyclase (GGDEF)-like protein